MKQMRIALGSNDGENIVPTHMGEAEYFYIYDLFEDGKLDFIEKRENTSPQEEGKHGLAKKRKAAMEIFEGADVIIGRKMSPNFVKIAADTKFQPVIVKIDKISEIFEEITKHFDEIYRLVEQREKGDRAQKIPKFGD